MLLEVNATVAIAHSRTSDLKIITHTANVLIAAVGQARLVTEDMFKPGVVVVDVCIH